MQPVLSRLLAFLLVGLAMASSAPAGNLLEEGGPACAVLAAACTAAGFAGPAGEIDCMGPLLAGQSGNGLPDLAAPQIAACNAAVASRKFPIPPAPVVADGTPAPGPGPMAALPWSGDRPSPPNIVLVLVDDFAMNLMSQDQSILSRTMPNLARMIRDGVTFTKYFVTDSLCCPSRSSIFTGKFPHNTGVFTNEAPDGGYDAFMTHGNDAQTFAVWLQRQGYATAMMGKYLNGYRAVRDGVPPGWTEWAVASNGYPNFNYVMNHNGRLIVPAPHLTDELAILGQSFVRKNADRPFFLELSTFSPHGPFVPPVRYRADFGDIDYPKTPAYGARPDPAAPDWLQAIQPLDARAQARMSRVFRDRLRSDKGVDDLIGTIRAQLQRLGIADRTYVIFTSDNGFHMGEYSLRMGKETAFDTDIRVPLVVVGPGAQPGAQVDALAQNIDLAPTFAQIAGLAPPDRVDGRSLLPWITGQPVADWRGSVLVEHHHPAPSAGDPDQAGRMSGNPPDYNALRGPDWVYVEYGTGEVEYHDLTTDPWELKNTISELSATRRAALHRALVAVTRCAGQASCQAAQGVVP